MEMEAQTKSSSKAEPVRRHRPNYVLVLIFLVVFTAVEVAVSYSTSAFRVPILLLLAFSKAALVILYFMHLRYDSRVYAYWFLLGLVLIFPLGIVLGLFNPGQ
jgi:caa(3)-type oxidase subunit IV